MMDKSEGPSSYIHMMHTCMLFVCIKYMRSNELYTYISLYALNIHYY
jgi:hypothetical protein